MTFSIAPLDSGVTRLTLEGHLDAFTIALLRPELLPVIRARPAFVEIDFCKLRSITARGIQILVSFCAELTRVGSRITIRGLRAQPLQRFRAAFVGAIRHETPSPN